VGATQEIGDRVGQLFFQFHFRKQVNISTSRSCGKLWPTFIFLLGKMENFGPLSFSSWGKWKTLAHFHFLPGENGILWPNISFRNEILAVSSH